MQYLQLKPEIHEYADTDLARHLRRLFNDPAIFTYRHMRRGTLVVASWIDVGSLIAQEHYAITDINDEGQFCNAVATLEWQRSPDTYYELKNAVHAVASEHRALEAEQDDELRAQEDQWDFLRQRYGGHRADSVVWDLRMQPTISWR